MTEDSLRKRYFYKLSTNFINLGLNVVIQAIVPRALGPILYGSYSFLTTFFQQILGFFDLWTTPGFYIKLSQRPRESGLVTFSLLLFSISSAIVIIAVFIISPDSALYKQIWPDQDFFYINLAAIWGILTWLLQLLNAMSDAYGLTVKSEKMRIAQKILGLIIILTLFILHKLDLKNYFYYNYITMIFLVVSFVWIIKHNGYVFINYKLTLKSVKAYFHEFYIYSSPLFLSGIMGLLFGIIDRWLLQYYAGSIQQGYYGLSYQVGMVCFLFTSAMTPLIMREFSIAFNQKNINQISILFRKYVPLLYSIAAYISCFLSIQANKIIHIMGGEQYKGAYLAVAIMCIYPIHQTYGQLSGSVFMATGQTRLYSKIGIIFLIIGLPLTYFLIASRSNMGLNAGAMGLSLKMVFIQIIVVNVLLYFNAKYLKLNFWKYLSHQFISIFLFMLISFLAMILIDRGFGIKNEIIGFFLSGALYSLIVGALLYFYPRIFGLTRENIDYFINQIRAKVS
jgi:O-antigen/teichoic acid export membrane protein